MKNNTDTEFLYMLCIYTYVINVVIILLTSFIYMYILGNYNYNNIIFVCYRAMTLTIHTYLLYTKLLYSM